MMRGKGLTSLGRSAYVHTDVTEVVAGFVQTASESSFPQDSTNNRSVRQLSWISPEHVKWKETPRQKGLTHWLLGV
jgi:hypothetical protein